MAQPSEWPPKSTVVEKTSRTRLITVNLGVTRFGGVHALRDIDLTLEVGEGCVSDRVAYPIHGSVMVFGWFRSKDARDRSRLIKGQGSKKGKNVERAKLLPADLRPCRRPEGFAGLLRALNLSRGCDT